MYAPDERNGITPVSKPQRHDPGAVVDAPDREGQDELLLGNADQLGDPGTLEAAKASTSRATANGPRACSHRNGVGTGRIGVVEEERLRRELAQVLGRGGDDGVLRSARNMPPGPIESAMCMKTP